MYNQSDSYGRTRRCRLAVTNLQVAEPEIAPNAVAKSR